MKIFNVAIRVSIQQIAVLPDDPTDGDAKPAKEAFNDDPLDKQDKILTKYMDRMEAIAGPQVPRMVTPQGDSAGMVRNVRIAASDFGELQKILAAFDETIKKLPAIPDSLLQSHSAIPIQPDNAYPGPLIG